MKKNILILALFGLAAGANAQAPLRTPKGASYTVVTKGTGEKVKLDDVLTFDVIQKNDKDSILYSTYKIGKPVKAQVTASQNVADLMELFPLLTVGDSVVAKVPVDSVFKGHEDQMPPVFQKGGNIVFNIKIRKTQLLADAIAERNAEGEKLKQNEGVEAAKYIADNKLTPVTTASGLKYIITTPSAKRKPLVGDTVLVNYTGSTLAGVVFDSSVAAEAAKANLSQPGRNYEPFEVVLGQGRVIPGWEEALLLLNEGAKAKVIIPSALAYGERGGGEVIKPYSTLLFDIELVKIKPAKHVKAAPVKAKPGAKKAPVKKAAAKKTVAGKKKN
ncbi:hypothetical protein GCM10023149_20100 [Mucilaginibacter gynuensis]|uniref:peptidylprolyl isomerase n=1 Tax=Mucilaginibacter gynuensis TaxID=1302236 RepID=A0ABP8GAH4_9SPHI